MGNCIQKCTGWMDEDDVVDWDKLIREYQEKHPPYRIPEEVSLPPIVIPPITPPTEPSKPESPKKEPIPPIEPPVHKFVRKNCLRFQEIEKVTLGNG